MINFFDKLEDWIRGNLSRHPITYSMIGGVSVVLFWRAVWETADMLAGIDPMLAVLFYPPLQLVISTILLLLTGLMVSIFIGDRIILSGLRHEKKLEERTEDLAEEEVVTLAQIQNSIHTLEKEIKKLTNPH